MCLVTNANKNPTNLTTTTATMTTTASTSDQQSDELCMTSENDVTSLIDTSNDDDERKSEKKYPRSESSDSQVGGRTGPVLSYKQMTKDKMRMFKYLMKPIVMTIIGVIICVIGMVMTVNHFLFEKPMDKNPVYLTYGPVAFASGVITFIFAIVWFSIKREKWLTGKASPILAILHMAALPAVVVDDELGSKKQPIV